MLPGAWSGGRGRRGALAGASAVVLCVGGLLAACGGDGREGHVATGAAADGPEAGPDGAVPPGGGVEFVPLDGRPSGAPSGRPPGAAPGQGPGEPGADPDRDVKSPDRGPSSRAQDTPGNRSPTTPGSRSPAPGSSGLDGNDNATGNGNGNGEGDHRPGRPGNSSGSDPTAPGATRPPSTPAPPAPAALKVGAPRRQAADKRWCEDVTLSFRNTGGAPVRSGSVTLSTHIIGGLGVDWGTIESTRKLPAPLGAGRTVQKTWPICVDWWRVPLGMHIETRDVDVRWK
ncbi:hypothetical protein [Streptomyces aureocirculatus]|uniref:hypothetical protein n=1 Tax=Streptomyces aureocirculatus TaxID=67275 RepID=UPI0004C82BDC|nr:hypothetical protein [Streptomyces aureocirculatus]